MATLASNTIEFGLGVPPEPRRRHRYLGQTSIESVRNHRLAKRRVLYGGTEDEHYDPQTYFQLREIGLSLYRNNGLVRGMIDRGVENVVGPDGYTYVPMSGDEGLNRAMADYWEEWSDSDADRTGRVHLTDLLAAAERGEWTAGDNFFFLDEVGIHGRGSLILIDGGRCVTPTNDEKRVVNGIRLSEHGEPTAYFFANDVPQSAYVSASEGRFYPASQVIHNCHLAVFAGQTRGIPVFCASVRDLDDLDALIVATRVAARIAADNGFFITKELDPEAYAMAVAETYPDDQDRANSEPPVERLENGLVRYLKVGEKMESVGSAHPAPQLESFIKLLVRMIGVAVGEPIEISLMDATETNLSSMRLVLEQAYRSFRCHQHRNVRNLRKFNRFAFGIAIREKLLPDKPEVYSHAWTPNAWPFFDILKESRARLDLLAAGLTSVSQILGEEGRTLDKVLAEQKSDREKFAAAGLPYPTFEPTTPKSTATSNVTQ